MKKILILFCLAFATIPLSAQKWGKLTGSFESNDHVYVTDKENGFDPENRIGSNNYLKLDYYKGRFSAGLQMEGYFPKLIGYPDDNALNDMTGTLAKTDNLDKFALSNLYVDWKDDSFQATLGTYYDQFGSGLLFRTWEDRLLGLNNALLGARLSYNWNDKIAVKGLWGLPRLGMTFSKTQIWGADLSVSLADLIGLDNIVLSLEGSYLGRHADLFPSEEAAGAKPVTSGWSGRFNFDYEGYFVKGEYVDLGRKLVALNPKRGNAQLIEAGYNGSGLGVTVTGRRLEWMRQYIDVNSMSMANLISYVPAMNTQYTYMLTTLHPYNPQVGDENSVGFNSGEIGGQVDAFYNFRRGTAIGGKRGMKIHANFSIYYTLAEEGTAKAGNLLLRDFSLDVERQWTKEFKMLFLYSMQEYNKSYGANEDTILSNIFVADLLYKWTPKLSTRLELQYLASKQDNKDWMAALLEVNFAPHWSAWASDMYNHGQTKMHYYNAGLSFTWNRIRVSGGYGRYKDGFICSGGVCRRIPQFTGANFSLTASF